MSALQILETQGQNCLFGVYCKRIRGNLKISTSSVGSYCRQCVEYFQALIWTMNLTMEDFKHILACREEENTQD
jgi:hypothetical protein